MTKLMLRHKILDNRLQRGYKMVKSHKGWLVAPLVMLSFGAFAISNQAHADNREPITTPTTSTETQANHTNISDQTQSESVQNSGSSMAANSSGINIVTDWGSDRANPSNQSITSQSPNSSNIGVNHSIDNENLSNTFDYSNPYSHNNDLQIGATYGKHANSNKSSNLHLSLELGASQASSPSSPSNPGSTGSSGSSNSSGGSSLSSYNWPKHIKANTTGHANTILGYDDPHYKTRPGSYPPAPGKSPWTGVWETTDMDLVGHPISHLKGVFCDNADWEGPGFGTKYTYVNTIQPNSPQYKVLNYIATHHVNHDLAEAANWAEDGKDGGLSGFRQRKYLSGTISKSSLTAFIKKALADNDQDVQAANYKCDGGQRVGGAYLIQGLSVVRLAKKGTNTTKTTGKGKGKSGGGGSCSGNTAAAAGAAGGAGAAGAAAGGGAAGGAGAAAGAGGATNGTAGGVVGGGNGNNNSTPTGPNNNDVIPAGSVTTSNNNPSNNNIVPEVPMVNNNDVTNNYPQKVDDHVGVLTALAALVSQESKSENLELANLQDKNMDYDLGRGQTRDNWIQNIQVDMAKRDGSLAAKINSAAATASNGSAIQSFAYSAGMQSMQNSLKNSQELQSVKDALSHGQASHSTNESFYSNNAVTSDNSSSMQPNNEFIQDLQNDFQQIPDQSVNESQTQSTGQTQSTPVQNLSNNGSGQSSFNPGSNILSQLNQALEGITSGNDGQNDDNSNGSNVMSQLDTLLNGITN